VTYTFVLPNRNTTRVIFSFSFSRLSLCHSSLNTCYVLVGCEKGGTMYVWKKMSMYLYSKKFLTNTNTSILTTGHGYNANTALSACHFLIHL